MQDIQQTSILQNSIKAITLAALVSGCSDTTLGRFTVDETIPESTIQGVGLSQILPLTFATIPMDVTSQEAYQQEDFDFLTEVKLSKLFLTIAEKSDMPDHDAFEDGNADNFDFISSLEITIQADIEGETQSDVIALLSTDDPQIASGTRTLKLTTTGVDILDYVEAENGYEILVSGSGTVPPDNVIFDGDASYRLGLGFR